MKKILIVLCVSVLLAMSCNNDNYPDSQQPEKDTIIIKDSVRIVDSVTIK